MSDFEKREMVIKVPRNTGVDGFVQALRGILGLSRVTEIRINTKGEFWFTRHVRPDEELVPIKIDFGSVTAAAAIQGGDVVEVDPAGPDEPAPVAIARLFAEMHRDVLAPVAFVVGPRSRFPAWHKASSGISVGDWAYGARVLQDDELPEETLVLCAAYSPGGSLVDVRRSYRMAMPGAAP
jgi:hypothetical protein